MRLVVATTDDDPFADLFWKVYYGAGGLPPTAVIFLQRRRRTAWWRRLAEGFLVFGPMAGVRVWTLARQTRRTVRETPEQMFRGVDACYFLASLNSGDGLRMLKRIAPDLLVSVGAPEIFKPPVLQAAALGAVNVHNGRLPAYRGLFGTFWEVYAGEAWGYTSIHVMEASIDTGPVLAQRAVWLAGRSLMEALGAKKRQGGRLLAWLVRFVDREGQLPAPCPFVAGAPSGYYPWPSLREMSLLGFKRWQRGRRSPQTAAPVDTWPPEAVLGDQQA